MNVDAHDRSELRRIAKQLDRSAVHAPGSSSVRGSNPFTSQRLAQPLRKKIHRLAPVNGSLVRVGSHHWIAIAGSRRVEGNLQDIQDAFAPLFNRFGIA